MVKQFKYFLLYVATLSNFGSVFAYELSNDFDELGDNAVEIQHMADYGECNENLPSLLSISTFANSRQELESGSRISFQVEVRHGQDVFFESTMNQFTFTNTTPKQVILNLSLTPEAGQHVRTSPIIGFFHENRRGGTRPGIIREIPITSNGRTTGSTVTFTYLFTATPGDSVYFIYEANPNIRPYKPELILNSAKALIVIP